jgi:hypothetical protein
VARQLAHEGDAEATDLGVTLALGVEVGSTFATAHHHCLPHQSASAALRGGMGISRFEQKLTASERILEDLLETEELEAISFVSFLFFSL